MPGSTELPRTVLAPGKLVLVGEYAVVDGVPAVVIAIDRGVRCRVRPVEGPLRITTPDGDSRFVAPALEGAPPAHYAFDAWNPVELPGKPGFGGSAAACVAACVAAGRPATDAVAIHHRVQGSGSGIDVLASIHGGMGCTGHGRWEALPPVLPAVVYSGRSARTGPRVQRYLALPDRTAFQRESAAITAAFPADPLAALQASAALLAQMAAQAGLDWLSPGLARIMALATDHGGAAKPSGAGGGDCAVALFPDPDRQEAFSAACLREGLPPISVEVAPGARVCTASGQAEPRR